MLRCFLNELWRNIKNDCTGIVAAIVIACLLLAMVVAAFSAYASMVMMTALAAICFITMAAFTIRAIHRLIVDAYNSAKNKMD